MILITGAAGKTGLALIAALAAREQPVRAFVRSAAQAAHVAGYGAEEVVVGDLRTPADVQQALAGAAAVYHICPNMQPDEATLGANMIAAAEKCGVRRFVYHSVLHPQTEEMPHHWQKLRVEERLFQSNLAWTIVQPAAYLQNILASRTEIEAAGRYIVPYPVETRLGMVDLLDVAAAATRVLTEAGHAGAVYELASGEVLTQRQVAAELAAALERPVEAIELAAAAWEQGARAAGLSDYAITTLNAMFGYYARYGFWGNPRVLTMLLGRAPTTLQQFLRRELL